MEEKKPDQMPEKLKKLVDNRIEQRKEEIKEEAKKELREELGQQKDSNVQENSKDEGLSRRGFLKKMGAGAVGLGALSLSPAAGNLRITNNGVFKDGKKVTGSGEVANPLENNLDGGSQTINNLSKLVSDKIEANSEIRLPNQKNTSNDNQIWIENKELKVKINGNIYRLNKFDALQSNSDNLWGYKEGSGTTIKDLNGLLDLTYDSLSWNTGSGYKDTYPDLYGTNNEASMGKSVFPSLRENATGTFISWVYPSSNVSGSWDSICGSDIRGYNNTGFGFGAIDGSIGGSLSISGDRARVRGTSPYNFGDSAVTDVWICYAAVIDSGNIEVYVAVPSNNYTLESCGTASTSNTTTSDWDSTAYMASDGYSNEYWYGNIDITLFDSSAWSKSKVQNFVDDSKGYY